MFLSAFESSKNLLHSIEDWIGLVLEYLIAVIDIIGAVIIVSGIIIAIRHIAKRTKNERLALARTTGLGLELIMCGEILRTITTRTKEELIILGFVVIIRGALAVLSHWEFKNEVTEKEKELEEVNEQVVKEEKELAKATKKGK